MRPTSLVRRNDFNRFRRLLAASSQGVGLAIRGGLGHAPGLGIPGKSEFPAGWGDDKIMHSISDVATDPASRITPQGSRSVVEGTREGVNIRVVIDNQSGRIITGYPVAPR